MTIAPTRDRSDTLPTFLIIGAMKAGTTSLYQHLSTHPDIYLSAVKEPNFFSDPNAWASGADRYRKLFRRSGSAVAVGEASTSYSRAGEFPHVPERIHSLLPNVRLVYLLRDPLERMVSMYRHEVLVGRERAPIDQALLSDDRYLDGSRYGRQIRLYLQYFSRDQIQVVLTDDLAADPLRTTAGVAAFLHADPDRLPIAPPPRYVTTDRGAETGLSRAIRRTPIVPWARRHLPQQVRDRARRALTTAAAPAEEMLSAGAAATIRERLQPEVEQLQQYLGEDLARWGFS